ncbi:MAG: STAS domain-containing protein [SAR324 cluster bacterium]|nr:STAS domain-containing protein [SAR324 cluster bacterium]
MHVSHSIKNKNCIVSIEGDVTIFKVPHIKSYLIPLIEKQTWEKLVLNFEKVTSLDSSGIIMILSLYRKQKGNDAEFIICQMNQEIYTWFQQSHLDGLFQVSSECLCGKDCSQNFVALYQ